LVSLICLLYSTLSTDEAESFSASLMTRGDPENIPLLPLDGSASLDLPPQSTKDVVTSTFAKAFAAVRSASQSISPQSMAEDSISGRASGTLFTGRCTRSFTPTELSLFDLVLLAQVVHEYAPVYGLFSNQCYLFASVIFDAVVQEFSLPRCGREREPSLISTSPLPIPSLEVGAPNNANIVLMPGPGENGASAEDGRWAGLQIVDPVIRQVIVGLVLSKFVLLRKDYVAGIAA
jgi:hypothetical protein